MKMIKKSRIEKEKDIIYKMIMLYCRGNHKKSLCSDCLELLNYSKKRLDLCKFGENKGFCSRCWIHCYNDDMRLKIKKVMRYSALRMLILSPVEFIKHLILS